MSQKIRTKNNNFYLAVAVILILLVIFAVIKKQGVSEVNQSVQTQTISPTVNPVKTYHSNFLKASIEYPHDFQLKEAFGEVILTKENKKIIFHWVGTNKIYSSLDDFINDKLALSVDEKEVQRMKLDIDGYDAESVEVKYVSNPADNNRAYYIFIDGTFYHLYTRSSDLYSDLDQIAQSFRYEP